MANIVYDLIPPQLLVDYVRAFDNEQLRFTFTLDQVLPNRNIEDLEFRVRQGSLQDVDVANFRAWDTPAPMTGRPGITRIRGELPPVSRQIALGEEEMLRLRQLDRQAAAYPGGLDPIVAAVYDDAERMVRSVQARIELARGEALTTGKVQINENGLVITADFGMPGTHIVTAAPLWTDTVNAKPLTDLLNWQETYLNDTGTVPAAIYMSRVRLANLFLSAEIRGAAAAGGITPARINKQELDAILDANALPPIITYDTQVRVNGTQTRVIPSNKVVFVPAGDEPLGNTFYGVTAEAIKLAGKGYIQRQDMPGIVALVTEEEHPVHTYTVATAIALPVIPNPKLLFVATVA